MSLLLAFAVGAALRAQDPVPVGPPPPAGQDPATTSPQGQQAPGVDLLLDRRAAPLLGKTIRTISVWQRERRGLQPMPERSTEAVLRSLLSRVGQALELRKVTSDIANLWHDQRLAVQAYVRGAGDQVELWFVVEREVQIYERVEFEGLHRFVRSDVDALLGLYPDRQVTSTEAQAMRNILTERYHRDGFAFVDIQVEESDLGATENSGDRPRKLATFRIDEGPKVTVGSVSFRGNASFPGVNPSFVSAGDYLVRESHMQHSPGWLLASGGAYSREILEEDLDRLQLFYRSRGFLDATVTVADARLRADNEKIDLDFLVVEGPRYVIRDLRLVHVDDKGEIVPETSARYSATDVRGVVKLKVGDFYDHLMIRRDVAAIEDYYGERGHPKSSFPGMDRIPGAFRVLPVKEHYDENAGVTLTFEIEEGAPKSLRDVVVRGNATTRDKVIRRKVYALPGDRVDMKKVQRSIAYLNRTGFFQDPLTLSGPRFEFLKTERDDVLDLAVDVTEAETGDIRWGAGITSGAGAQATFAFRKKNFDLWRPPSSWNPITMFGEILDNRAFHGGGQTLDMTLAPGTQVSQGSIGFTEPDLFGEQFETTELRVNAHRTLRNRDGYRSDTIGADVGLFRNLSDEWSIGIAVREENVEVANVSPDATSLAFAAEGNTEIRGARLRTVYRDVDDLRRPTEGFDAQASYELLGGAFGAEVDMWKAMAGANFYVPIAENVLGHRTVLHFEQQFGLAQAIQGSRDVFLSERFYLGGSTSLRGFDYRGVGPSQFDRPFGGEATLYGTAEVSFPLVPTRLEHELRDRELLRGVVFVDYGLLGLGIQDETFGQLRLSYGIGLRIDVPVVYIPIALDLGWPILREETDHERAFLFSISYN